MWFFYYFFYWQLCFKSAISVAPAHPFLMSYLSIGLYLLLFYVYSAVLTVNPFSFLCLILLEKKRSLWKCSLFLPCISHTASYLFSLFLFWEQPWRSCFCSMFQVVSFVMEGSVLNSALHFSSSAMNSCL